MACLRPIFYLRKHVGTPAVAYLVCATMKRNTCTCGVPGEWKGSLCHGDVGESSRQHGDSEIGHERARAGLDIKDMAHGEA